MSIDIGTSGWSYEHRRGILYPAESPARERLSYYLREFQTVELNSSFYHWPRETTFLRWRNELPENFRLTIKAPRGLTHSSRLKAPERWVERIQRCFEILPPTQRGVLLVQLHPHFECDPARLDYFLEVLPGWMKVAVEFRHPSWNREGVFRLLEKRGAAYCVMSGANLPCILKATAPFVYLRFHGPDRDYLYAGSYTDEDLLWWTERIREWTSSRREVFAYFNNDGSGHAVRNAITLKRMSGV